MKALKKQPIRIVLAFYLVCFLFRAVEYLFLRTDQSIFGEAFVHKLAGILLLAVTLRMLQYSWADIGFVGKRALRGTILGLVLGGSVFFIAYGAEIWIHTLSGNAPQLRFFVTSYAIQGNRGMQTGFEFILFCVLGNIINVFMEEGVFRGLFPRVIQERNSFWVACLISSVLFGLWHVAQPLRNLLDGEQSAMGALMSCILLVSTSTLLAIQFCMLAKITGSLWAGMAAHFINNAGVNLLHVATASGIDELQTMRIAIAQALSFVIVLIMYVVCVRKQNATTTASVSEPHRP